MGWYDNDLKLDKNDKNVIGNYEVDIPIAMNEKYCYRCFKQFKPDFNDLEKATKLVQCQCLRPYYKCYLGFQPRKTESDLDEEKFTEIVEILRPQECIDKYPRREQL